nr:VCBS repeat-containing protein [uncultured Friedmanniella sp.]
MGRRTVPAAVAAVLLSLPLAVLDGPAAQAAAEECALGVESDFNGDGWADAAVADPYATVDGAAEAGRVVVMYGDADGRVGQGARGTVQQGTKFVAGSPEARDRFGFSLAVADLDCDGYSDLVVGVPYENVGGAVDSGLVQLVYGSGAGLGGGRISGSVNQSSFAEPVQAGDRLGWAVDALEDVGQGGTPAPDAYAVAVGAPGRDVGGAADAGWAGFLVAYDGGNEALAVTQDSPGIPGIAETGDRFGAAVTLNYLAGESGTVDAVVGVPNEDIGSVLDAGAVSVLRDIYFEPTGVGLDQGSPGVAGAPERGDRFGEALDSVQVGATTRLAVGVAREDIGSAADAGSVQLFGSNGSTLTATQAVTQNTAGVSGVSESGDRFGDRLAFARPAPGVGSTRLAVGVPGEDGAAADSGLVQVFPVDSVGSERSYGQHTAGVPGSAQAGDRFGTAVGVVTGAGEQALLVGVPEDASSRDGVVDVIPLTAGTPRAWVPGAGGVVGGGAQRFGATVASGGQQ